VNYYEHHLGDWAAATGHLTWDEDMAYTRLLRAYYHHEKPIAEGQQYRLAKASTPAQRRAVDQVLGEFFELRDGHFWQKRADAEIARYQDKQRKAKASADARWSQSGRNANASPDAMRTHSEGNALQTPDTRHQTPDKARALLPDGELPAPSPTAAGAICRAMKQAGLSATNPGDPRLLALIEQGATEAEFAGIAAEAVAKAKGWAWVLHVLQARRSEAAAIALAPPTPDRRNGAAATPSAEQTKASLDSQRMTDAERVASKEARDRVMATLRPALRNVTTS
jgi:uncharacterized protein YdaU (DUF1376 family)